MSESDKSEGCRCGKEKRPPPDGLEYVVFGAGVIALVIGACYVFVNTLSRMVGPQLPGDAQKYGNLGQVGDSFNILTALFSGAALIFIGISVRQSNKALSHNETMLDQSAEELRLTKDAMIETQKEMKAQTAFYEKQRVIQQFFEQLNSFHSLIGTFKKIEVKTVKEEVSSDPLISNQRDVEIRTEHIGAAVFDVHVNQLEWFTQINPNGRDLSALAAPYEFQEARAIMNAGKIKEVLTVDGIRKNYERLYDKKHGNYQQWFAQYFRTLFNLMRSIDDEFESIDLIKKYELIRIARASLSQSELLVIAVNCLTKNGEPMKRYVERYNILDNIDESIIWSKIEGEFDMLIQSGFDYMDWASDTESDTDPITDIVLREREKHGEMILDALAAAQARY